LGAAQLKALAMIEKLLEWDQKLLLALNSIHHSALDPVVYLASQTWFWIPLYGVLLWLTIRVYGKDTWIVLAGIAFTILFTDQFTSSFMKPFFGRLRPSHEPALHELLHMVRNLKGEIYTGGLYGFASGHAANTFGTATFFVLLFRSTRPWIYLLFLWAFLMTYTRIYMGVHYPGDILVGTMIGLLGGWLGFRFCQWSIDRRKTNSTGG
jgi:undecaprenyl-diphosphatase